MTQEQPYEIIGSGDGIEIRAYPAAAVAEVTVGADFEAAGTAAFGRLFGYISGRNSSGQSLAMTAPVIQDPVPGGGQRVAFVLPEGVSAAQAPAPGDPTVTVREHAATTAAAIRYSGRWSEESFRRHADLLGEALARQGWTATGAPRFARYNAPFTPWFLRRNEVIVEVRPASGPGSQ